MSQVHEDPRSEISCEYIADNAAGISSLSSQDREYQLAHEHAQACEDCAAALAQGAYTVAWIDKAARLATPDPKVIHALAIKVRERLHREEARAQRVWPLAAAALILVEAGALLGFYPGKDDLTWALAIALTLASAASLWATLARRQSGYLVALAAISIASVGVNGSSGGELHAAIGSHCMMFELMTATAPLALGATLLRLRKIEGAQRVMLASGFAGAVVGQAVLLHACPAQQSLMHLLGFHVVGVLLIAIISGLAGRWFETQLVGEI